MNFESFRKQANSFLDKIFQELKSSNLSIEPHWMIDHLCFRVETQEEYQIYKRYFSDFADLLIESPVNQRLISTYQLKDPIHFNNHKIGLVELPAPKLTKKVATGFEHFEVVSDLSFAEIEDWTHNCIIDKSGLSKLFNKEFEIKLQTGSVKFHQLSLASVICLEQQTKIFNALTKSKILELLSPYDPLIAGSVPLGLAESDADVDILLSAGKMSLFQNFIQEILSKKFELSVKSKRFQNEESLIVQFKYQDVKFELVVQEISTHRQLAYQHFQTEERLLMLGDLQFFNQIKSLRKQGIKTEPAFAKALGLAENPYLEIAKLRALSEKNLMTRFFS